MKFRNYLRVGLLLALLATSAASCKKGDDPTPDNGGSTVQPNPGDKTDPEVKSFSVKYDADGGSATLPGTATIKQGESVTVTDVKPVKEDFLFEGWKGSDGKTYKPGDKITVSADLTLTAIWKEDTTPKVSFDANGATVKGEAPKPMRLDNTIKLPDAGDMTRLGFQLSGWSTDKDAKTADLKPGSDYKNTKAETLYAVWTPVSFQITYKRNNDPRANFVTTIDGTAIENGAYFDYGYTNAEGKQLMHWVDADGNIYVPRTPISIDKDIELSAVYAEPSQFQNWNVIQINN